MKRNLMILEWDGIIADRSGARKVAEERREHALSYPSSDSEYGERVYQSAMLDPNLVSADVPVAGAVSRLRWLLAKDWELVVLTSRPLAMLEETMLWNVRNIGLNRTPFIFKPKKEAIAFIDLWKVKKVKEIVDGIEYKPSFVSFLDPNKDTLRTMRSYYNWIVVGDNLVEED